MITTCYQCRTNIAEANEEDDTTILPQCETGECPYGHIELLPENKRDLILIQEIIHDPEVLQLREPLKLTPFEADILKRKIKIYKNYLTKLEQGLSKQSRQRYA